MENIVCYRLINGYEIVGKVDELIDKNLGENLHIKNALTHIISQSEGKDGTVKMSMSFVPISFLTASDHNDLPKGCDIILKKSAIAFQYELAPQYLESYIQQTSPIIMNIGSTNITKLS